MAINYQSFEEWILGQIPKDPLYTGNLIIDHIEQAIWKETGEHGLKLYLRFTDIDCESLDLFLFGNTVRIIKTGYEVERFDGYHDLSHGGERIVLTDQIGELNHPDRSVVRTPSSYTHHKEKKSNDPKVLTGTFMYFDRINANGRMYSSKCLSAFEDFKRVIHDSNALGCLGYPDRIDGETPLAQVSHRITEIHYDPSTKTLIGTAELLQTPMGEKARKMIKEALDQGEKSPFVFRSRGTGNINEKNEVENFKVFSFDLVPRETDAFKEFEDGN